MAWCTLFALRVHLVCHPRWGAQGISPTRSRACASAECAHSQCESRTVNALASARVNSVGHGQTDRSLCAPRAVVRDVVALATPAVRQPNSPLNYADGLVRQMANLRHIGTHVCIVCYVYYSIYKYIYIQVHISKRPGN